MEDNVVIRKYLWIHYRSLIHEVEKKLVNCSSSSTYPACVEGLDYSYYSLAYRTYWDFVFDTIIEEYPDIAMEAYLLNFLY